ncbi:MAG: hypothetical protein OXC11_06220 [Rhodospirillales bacterium]|nr:hypothetical protein [Rhodospirillales bacterium]
MEAVLDVAAGTGVLLLLLAVSSPNRALVRWGGVGLAAGVAYSLHPLAVRQNLPALVAHLTSPLGQSLAALMALEGVLGCVGAALLLRVHHGFAERRLLQIAGYYPGVIPLLALFYIEVKVFHAATQWPFRVTALVLSLGIVTLGLTGCWLIRRVLADHGLRHELRLVVHAGQIVLAFGLTALGVPDGAEGTGPGVEFEPFAVLAGVSILGVLVGFWGHRRRTRRATRERSDGSHGSADPRSLPAV